MVSHFPSVSQRVTVEPPLHGTSYLQIGSLDKPLSEKTSESKVNLNLEKIEEAPLPNSRSITLYFMLCIFILWSEVAVGEKCKQPAALKLRLSLLVMWNYIIYYIELNLFCFHFSIWEFHLQYWFINRNFNMKTWSTNL